MAEAIYAGSAPEDAAACRGWAQWVTAEVRTALIALVSGRFRIEFREQSVVLATRGDYVVFQGVDHSWFAEEDSVIVGVRWPSVPGYAVSDDS